jgi:hypothetical protein
MSSTYSSYKFELIGTGEQAGTWGTSTNTNLGTAIEQAIGGYVSVAFTGLTKSLTLTNTSAAQDARALYLNLTGTPGGAATLEVPAIQKAYIIKNATTGGFAVTAKVSGMTGVLIPNGKTMLVYNNGTDVVVAHDNFSAPVTINVNSASDALRITQTGSGNALLVEDEANPDTSPFVVDSAGRVGIGIATPGAVGSLRISRRLTGATAGATVYADYTVASDVTGSAATYRSDVTTDAAAFTLPFLTHYTVTGLTVGAGSTVTDQRGFSIAAAAVGATNNYGVFSFLPAGTNNWNLYASGTAPNYMAGALGIGSTTLTGFRLRVGGTVSETSGGSGTATNIFVNATFDSTVNAVGYGVRSLLATAASAFTIPNVYHFTADALSLGAGSAVTNQMGYIAGAAFTGATNNYGYFGNVPSGTNNWNFYAANTAPNYMAGALGIGSTTLTGFRLRVGGTVSETTPSGGVAYVASINGTFDSTVTAGAFGVRTGLSTAASAFTAANVYHFTADSLTLGAGSAATNQFGFYANSTLTNATNNYGLYSAIPSGTNNWNLYASNTAPNYMAGALGIGTTTLGAYNFRIERNLTGGVNSSSISNDFTALSDVTSNVHGIYSQIDTQNAVYTLTNLQHFTASGGTKGASSTITFQYGFLAQSTLSQATNNYAFYTNLAASGSNNWGFYSTGTAPNYMAGALGIGGSTTLTGINFQVGRALTGAVTSISISNNITVQSDVTSNAYGFYSNLNTQAAAFTLPNLYHYTANGGAAGAGSTVTNQYGFFVANGLSQATNNYGFYGNLTASGSSNWNIYANGTAPNYMAGSLGIGTTSLTGYTLRVGKNLTGAAVSYQVAANYTVQSDVSGARTFQSAPSTQATAFTLGSLYHFVAEVPGVGAGSTITNQYGFLAANGLEVATNNYGFASSIASGANNWNIYSSGTAKNYLAGALGIGVTSSTASLAVNRNLTGATSNSQVVCSYTVLSDVTSTAYTFESLVQTEGAAFTLGNLAHYHVSGLILGGGSAVTNQYALQINDISGATNNYGVYSNISSGANKWSFYSIGTANNAFNGNTRFGSTTAPVATVDVTGSVAATTSIRSSGGTSGIGYATGAGGTVTQNTSRTTAVTLDKVTGAITLVSAAGSASYQSFTVTNSAVAATDVVIVNQKSGTDKYITLVTNVAAGSFQITFATTGGTTTEQPVFNFAVIKAVTA